MAFNPEALIQLQELASKPENEWVQSMGQEDEGAYAAQLNKSISVLQRQVALVESEINKRRQQVPISIDQPSEDAGSRARQVRAITTAFRNLTDKEPMLPSVESPLPALMALRKNLVTIHQLKDSIRDSQRQIVSAKKEKEREQRELDLSISMTTALERKLESLKLEKESMCQNGPDFTATSLWQKQHQKTIHFDQDLKRLVLAFRNFVDKHLAMMLAAEELGGPVVGDDIGLSEANLRVGFTKLGRPKKVAVEQGHAESHAESHENETHSDDDNPSNTSKQQTSLKAAAEEFRNLSEALMNAAADEESPSPYVVIERESSAVRFLVRAKVAQFHPEDAKRLRLVDFAGSFG